MKLTFGAGSFSSGAPACKLSAGGSAVLLAMVMSVAQLAAASPTAAEVRSAQASPGKSDKDGKSKTPAPASSTAPAPSGDAAPSAWAVTCSDRAAGKFQCEMTQAIVDQASRSPIVLISVRSPAEGTAKAMLLRVIHGVYLPAGITARVDSGSPMPVQFQKSDTAGVYAVLPLTDMLVADLKKGKDLKISLELNKGVPLNINAALNGFGPAYDRVSTTK